MKLNVQEKTNNEYLDILKPLDKIQCLFFGDPMENRFYPVQLRLGINEGECKTYPKETTMRYLSNTCQIPKEYIREGEFDKNKIVVIIPKEVYTKNVVRNVSNVMNLCGWYELTRLRNKNKEGKWFCSIYYEPKYPFKENIFIPNGQFIYHISPKKYLHKIMKQGFCPSNKSMLYTYPSRNYFFTDSKIDLIGYMDAFNKSKNSNDEYVLYTIDTRKISHNITFYNDNNLHGGIFTSENIPPTAIVSVKDLK